MMITIPEEDKVSIAPELLVVANEYLKFQDLDVVASQLNLGRPQVAAILEKPAVKRYIDRVFMEQGYRNRHKLASVMDSILEAKLEEAAESEMWSKKDLLEVIAQMHKMNMDFEKLAREDKPKIQVNTQINNNEGFGDGNYGALMERLVNGPRDSTT